jgi:hypothetical protein
LHCTFDRRAIRWLASVPEPASKHPVWYQREVARGQQCAGHKAAYRVAVPGDAMMPGGENEHRYGKNCDDREDVDEAKAVVVDVADSERD